jgi:DNA-directed RNA polymerase subunit beta'
MQGAVINDKHIEVVAKQMFSRVKIKEEGDTKFSKGKVIEGFELTEENERVKKEGNQEAAATPLVMPISKVSLSSSSFLAAASFQDTARVLIRSAIEGREDKLRGLKENVIIGRLIPAGTGYRGDFVTNEGELEPIEELGEDGEE